MGVYQNHTATSLARAAKVSEQQIWDWFRAGLLKGDLRHSVVTESENLFLPLTETVAAVALRDGKDPQAARDELFKGRDLFRAPDVPDYRTQEEKDASLASFLHKQGLPPPDRSLERVDPRKERE